MIHIEGIRPNGNNNISNSQHAKNKCHILPISTKIYMYKIGKYILWINNETNCQIKLSWKILYVVFLFILWYSLFLEAICLPINIIFEHSIGISRNLTYRLTLSNKLLVSWIENHRHMNKKLGIKWEVDQLQLRLECWSMSGILIIHYEFIIFIFYH